MKSYCKGYTIGHRQLYGALADWSAHTSGRKNKWRLESEYGGADALVDELSREIKTRTLTFEPMRHYVKNESGNGKRRELTVESCKQQICDYAVVHAIEPLFRAKVGFWQYGGEHVRSNIDLSRAIKRWSQDGGYWVHLDVRKCYQSISCDLVRRMLAKYVRSPDVLYVADHLLAMHGDSLALGSYLSLKVCQLLLSFGYHYVESLHKTRRGERRKLVAHQGWYMDDIWLFSQRKRDLQSAARSLETWLGKIGLTLHPWQVCKVGADPIDVAGYVVRPDRVTLRSSAFLRMDRARRRFKRGPILKRARSFVSHKGQLDHTDSVKYRTRHDVDITMGQARYIISKEAA